MREAIGATWILGIVLTFIALFSGYLAFSVNYSKAFRMKDGIIDRIEKHNGPSTEAINEINDFMNEISYSARGTCQNFFNDSSQLKWAGINHGVATTSMDVNSGDAFNYCLQRVDAFNTNGQLSASYYKVYVFFSISIPIIDTSNWFHVSGETANIYYPNDSLPYRNRR